MRTTPLKGKYFPALINEADLSPTMPTYETALGRCDYMGAISTNGATVYLWSPFIKTDPNALVNPETLKVKNADNELLIDAVKTVRVTTEGIIFELDPVVLRGSQGANYRIDFLPDATWPKLDGILEPGFGAIAFKFPVAWVTG